MATVALVEDWEGGFTIFLVFFLLSMTSACSKILAYNSAHAQNKMDGEDAVKHLIITEVKFSDRELGRAYRRVIAVDYNGITCAAKEIKFHSSQAALLAFLSPAHIKQAFLQECLQHSKLHHPNIVKMLGVYYPNGQAGLPVLVMELMQCNLTQLLENYHNIPMYVKLSILQDVSRAICYLHTLNPPLMHRDLTCNNVLLTTSLVAKVCDFGPLKAISPSSGPLETCSASVDCMPPEALKKYPHYGLPLDVFSFGCVVCHVITQRWPTPLHLFISSIIRLTEVERRQRYIDEIREGSLKQLVITCLDNDQERRPPISLVSERITSIITG